MSEGGPGKKNTSSLSSTLLPHQNRITVIVIQFFFPPVTGYAETPERNCRCCYCCSSSSSTYCWAGLTWCSVGGPTKHAHMHGSFGPFRYSSFPLLSFSSVRACVRACVCVCVCFFFFLSFLLLSHPNSPTVFFFFSLLLLSLLYLLLLPLFRSKRNAKSLQPTGHHNAEPYGSVCLL